MAATAALPSLHRAAGSSIADGASSSATRIMAAADAAAVALG